MCKVCLVAVLMLFIISKSMENNEETHMKELSKPKMKKNDSSEVNVDSYFNEMPKNKKINDYAKKDKASSANKKSRKRYRSQESNAKEDVPIIKFQGIYASQKAWNIIGIDPSVHPKNQLSEQIDFEINWSQYNKTYPFRKNEKRNELQRIIENNLKDQMPYLLKTKNAEGKTDDMVKVQPTNDGKGDGLFAVKTFLPGDIIGLFNGNRYTQSEYLQLNRFNWDREDYILPIDVVNKKTDKYTKLIIDPFHKTGVMNDCRNILEGNRTKIDQAAQNAMWIIFRYNELAYVAEVAIKKINPEEEILTFYGPRFKIMDTINQTSNPRYKKNNDDQDSTVENDKIKGYFKENDLIGKENITNFFENFKQKPDDKANNDKQNITVEIDKIEGYFEENDLVCVENITDFFQNLKQKPCDEKNEDNQNPATEAATLIEEVDKNNIDNSKDVDNPLEKLETKEEEQKVTLVERAKNIPMADHGFRLFRSKNIQPFVTSNKIDKSMINTDDTKEKTAVNTKETRCEKTDFTTKIDKATIKSQTGKEEKNMKEKCREKSKSKSIKVEINLDLELNDIFLYVPQIKKENKTEEEKCVNIYFTVNSVMFDNTELNNPVLFNDLKNQIIQNEAKKIDSEMNALQDEFHNRARIHDKFDPKEGSIIRASEHFDARGGKHIRKNDTFIIKKHLKMSKYLLVAKKESKMTLGINEYDFDKLSKIKSVSDIINESLYRNYDKFKPLISENYDDAASIFNDADQFTALKEQMKTNQAKQINQMMDYIHFNFSNSSFIDEI